jgi:protein-L-isoaspartate(D-aspartate) O-methyltransferase
MKAGILLITLSLLLGGFSWFPEEDTSKDSFAAMRKSMVVEQIRARGIRDQRVLEAMGSIPRHMFVAGSLRDKAYADHPLPIGEGQTISQPYIVALMTEALKVRPDERVLEIGTGSGYQAAVLSRLVKEVYTIEIREGLAKRAGDLLDLLEHTNVKTRYADGYFGWEEHAPFDAIMITAFANHIPPPLLKQLKVGGRLIIPLGSTLYFQTLTLVTKLEDGLDVQQLSRVRFVPMTGEVTEKR